MKFSKIGLDLAKTIFHLACLNEHDQLVNKKRLHRAQVLPYFARLEPCRIGMEACASAHYWARELIKLGHDVKLIPAQHVKPLVQGNKNDYNDALAIAEALSRPNLHFVAVKSPEQQDLQSLHRVRQRCIQARTALSNQLRGLLGEYGISFGKGLAQLRRQLPQIMDEMEKEFSGSFMRLLNQCYQQLQELDNHITYYTGLIEQHAKADEASGRLQTIPGFGPIVTSVFLSVVGHGEGYRRGRDVSASLGLVPRQHSTGGKHKLLGISKRGNSYLRSLLIHGARAYAIQAEKRKDALSLWVTRLKERRGFNKAVVALANKMARMGWAILHYGSVYEPRAAMNRA